MFPTFLVSHQHGNNWWVFIGKCEETSNRTGKQSISKADSQAVILWWSSRACQATSSFPWVQDYYRPRLPMIAEVQLILTLDYITVAPPQKNLGSWTAQATERSNETSKDGQFCLMLWSWRALRQNITSWFQENGLVEAIMIPVMQSPEWMI